MIDLTAMSGEEFAEHHIAVLTEKERRDNLARIPDQMAALQANFIAGGGEKAVIDAALAAQAAETGAQEPSSPDPDEDTPEG